VGPRRGADAHAPDDAGGARDHACADGQPQPPGGAVVALRDEVDAPGALVELAVGDGRAGLAFGDAVLHVDLEGLVEEPAGHLGDLGLLGRHHRRGRRFLR